MAHFVVIVLVFIGFVQNSSPEGSIRGLTFRNLDIGEASEKQIMKGRNLRRPMTPVAEVEGEGVDCKCKNYCDLKVFNSVKSC